MQPADALTLASVLFELGMWGGVFGALLALAAWTLVKAAGVWLVGAFDERQARKRLADKHYRELLDDQP